MNMYSTYKVSAWILVKDKSSKTHTTDLDSEY